MIYAETRKQDNKVGLVRYKTDWAAFRPFLLMGVSLIAGKQIDITVH